MLRHATPLGRLTDQPGSCAPQVKALFAKLGSRLDALFNFHAVPRPHKPEATIRAAVSTVALEEATPSAMTAHEALAPEEVCQN